MTETDLRALVDWTVEDSAPGRSVARALGALVHLASTVVTLDAVQLRLPATALAELVQVTRRDVWTTSPGRPPSGSLTGGWLALAWLRHLAGWPEPAPAEASG
jgi:hypothetical protein